MAAIHVISGSYSTILAVAITKMTVTFLVALNLSDLTILTEVALDLQDDLERAGHAVESVKPWARPTRQYISPFEKLPDLVEPPAEPTPPAL